MYKLFQYVLLLLVFGACQEDTSIAFAFKDIEDFYPLDSNEVLFKVDSITFDLFGTQQIRDSSSSFIKESYMPVSSNECIVESYTADSLNALNWTLTNTYLIKIVNNALEEIHGSLHLLKLQFPIKKGSQWVESKYMSSNYEILVEGEAIQPFIFPWNASIKDVGLDTTINQITYQQLLYKNAVNEDANIHYRKLDEFYAAGMGLVYSELWILDTQCEHKGGEIENCIDDSWKSKANRGFIIRKQRIN